MAQGVNAHDQPEIIARLTPESADLFQVGKHALQQLCFRWPAGADVMRNVMQANCAGYPPNPALVCCPLHRT